jgi:hypothetical protein
VVFPLRHVSRVAFFPEPRQQTKPRASSALPPFRTSSSADSSSVTFPRIHCRRRIHEAPLRIRAARARSPPSAPPDVMRRPHFPDQAFTRGNEFFDGEGGGKGEIEEAEAAATVAVEQSSSPSASSPAAAMSSCGQYILHRVGKLDTLAGVAIKYGVEVKRRDCCWFFRVAGFNIALAYLGGYKIEAVSSLQSSAVLCRMAFCFKYGKI